MTSSRAELLQIYNSLIDDETHLKSPSEVNVYAVDHLNRQGPKFGVELSAESAQAIVSSLPAHLAGSLTSYRVSTRGYNNRLYFASIETQCKDTARYIFKVCGRYWRQFKTETEVVGLWLAHTHAHIPVPELLHWDSSGDTYGVEYTLMRTLLGVPVDLLWERLTHRQRKNVVKQLADIASRLKTCVGHDLVDLDRIGNWKALRDSVSGNLAKATVGPTVEGEGPWSTYKSYYQSRLTKQLTLAQSNSSFEPFMSHLWPRIAQLIDGIESNSQIPENVELVFSHGDLDAQNILVHPNATDPTEFVVSAILDWEWSGVFPAEEEFFTSFTFISDDSEPSLNSYFWDQLEARGVLTPRTMPHYDTRKALYDLRENIAPWHLLDRVDENSDEVRQSLKAASGVIEKCLVHLNH